MKAGAWVPGSRAIAKNRKAVGVIRVSQTKGREGESFASPKDQRDRILAVCEANDLSIDDASIFEEMDVSGGMPLEQRPGLGVAVRRIEAGEAQVLVAAYLDRLFRSLKTQEETIRRIEENGGEVFALDMGQVSHATAGQWLSGTILGAFNEYFRRSVAEKAGDAQARAVLRGVAPWPRIPPGYRRDDRGVLVPSADAETVKKAFEIRADGATVRAVREHLAGHGIERSYHGVLSMLASPVYVGEIHFGKLSNLEAHAAIVDRGTWDRVQQMVVSRGRKAKSDGVLARRGVLRCGTCGSRMVVGSANNQKYPIYRCPPTGDCTQRVSISALIAEDTVSRAVREALSDAEGHASTAESAQQAARALETAQDKLDAALTSFQSAGVDTEPAGVRRLTELRKVRDAAKEHHDRLAERNDSFTINVDRDWDDLSRELRRRLISATVDRATVRPGRGTDRISITLVH